VWRLCTFDLQLRPFAAGKAVGSRCPRASLSFESALRNLTDRCARVLPHRVGFVYGFVAADGPEAAASGAVGAPGPPPKLDVNPYNQAARGPPPPPPFGESTEVLSCTGTASETAYPSPTLPNLFLTPACDTDSTTDAWAEGPYGPAGPAGDCPIGCDRTAMAARGPPPPPPFGMTGSGSREPRLPQMASRSTSSRRT
jgi:hypothetical protein